MGVLCAAWSSDGQRVAVGGQDGKTRVYDRDGTVHGLVEARDWVAASDWVTALAWSPEAPVLAIGVGRSLLIADVDGCVQHHFDDQSSTVTDVAWSADGSRVGVAAYNGVGWHDVVGKRAGRRRRFNWKGSLLTLEMSPDGKWACAGAQDATVQIWKLWSGKDLSMAGYPAKIEHLAFRHDSRWLAVACRGQLSVWDFGGSGPAGTAPASGDGHKAPIETLAWSPSGSAIATGGDNRTIVWSAPEKAGQKLWPVTALESDAATSRLGWVDDSALLIGRADGGIALVDLG